MQATLLVIPAQAGIQWWRVAIFAAGARRQADSPLLDSGLRRNDGEGNTNSSSLPPPLDR
jgi:hypothetical protein